MPTVKLSPILNDQVCDETGAPAVGWKIYSYIAGSSTPQKTYTSAAGDVEQPNPIVLDALGFSALGPIWLASGVLYKLVLTDQNDVVKKTFDNIAGTNDSVATTSQWIASGVPPTYISGTSFSVPGDQTSEFHIGRREQFSTGAGTLYGTIINSVYNGTTLTTVTVLMDSGALDNGLTAVNHSILRADNIGVPANVIDSIPLITGLSGTANAGTPTTKFDVTASRVSTIGPNGKVRTYTGVGTKTVDITIQGLGGRDQAGAFAAFAEPNLFYVPDGTGGLSVVASLNDFATGPTGYTEFSPIMNHKLNGGTQFYQGKLTGMVFELNTPSVLTTALGSAFPAAVSHANYAPAKARSVRIYSFASVGTTGSAGSVSQNLSNQNTAQYDPSMYTSTTSSTGAPIVADMLMTTGRQVFAGYSNSVSVTAYSQTVRLMGWTTGA
jgi:hypothetical protein